MPTYFYNLALVGPNRAGKTVFVNRHAYPGEFTSEYVQSVDDNITDISFVTNRGDTIVFIVYTIPGQDTPNYYNKDCAIIMFDTQSPLSFLKASSEVRRIKSQGNMPFVVCGNKSDLPKKVPVGDYIEMSVKTTYNYRKPFLVIARRMLNDSKLEFL